MPFIPKSEAKMPTPNKRANRRLEYAPQFIIDPQPTSPHPGNLPVGPQAEGAAGAENSRYRAGQKASNNVPMPDNYQPPTNGGTLREMQKG